MKRLLLACVLAFITTTANAATTIYSATLNNNSPGWQGYSMRLKLNSTGIASLGQVRVTFTASTAAGMTVDTAAVAVVGGATFPNTAATPTQLFFSGAPGFTISAGTTITSDWVNFTASGSDEFVVVTDFNAGTASAARSLVTGSADYQFKAASASYNSSTVTGYTDGGATTYTSLIETQTVSSGSRMTLTGIGR